MTIFNGDFSFNSSFIGYPEHQRFEKFNINDSIEKFNKNLEKLGSGWEYSNLDFDYKRNEYGHRSLELSEINLDNYILFAGCSYIEGIGLPADKRFSNVLGSLLECDIYNMGLSSAGNDIIAHNLITWFNKIKQKPKLVIVRWSENSRYMTVTNGNVNTHGSWNNAYRDFAPTDNFFNYFDSKTFIFRKLVSQVIDVPIIEIPWLLNKMNDNVFQHIVEAKYDKLDRARDLFHPGIQANKMNALSVFDYIKKVELL